MAQTLPHNGRQQPPKREFAFGEEDFRFLADLTNRCTGIVLGDQKRDMIYSRLAGRLRKLGLKSFGQYCDLLESEAGEAELGELVNAVTTNLTSFFREIHHFEHLRDTVLKPLVANPPPDKRLRIWSAACSSGMEPYSIAMTMKGAIRDIDAWDARILATDIDSNMIATGSAGEYAANDHENIPQAYRGDVHKAAKQGRVCMSEELKRLIAFRCLNLLGPWPMKGHFDAIFCRNVVIYFDKPTKQELFARMADILLPGGWLYIGHSENLHDISDRFELLGRTIYRKVN